MLALQARGEPPTPALQTPDVRPLPGGGYGGRGSERIALADNPCDGSLLNTDCWKIENLGGFFAQQIEKTMAPFLEWIVHNPGNIFTTTCLETQDTGTQCSILWQHSHIGDLLDAFMAVADAAVGVVVAVIGLLTILRAQLAGLRKFEMLELLTRLLLAVVGVHFSLPFLQLFIQINNDLCDLVIRTTQQTGIASLLSFLNVGALLASGPIGFVMGIAFFIMLVIFFFMNAVRLAFLYAWLVFVSLAALACATPYTMWFARSWLMDFLKMLFVQVLQITVLCVGDLLIIAVRQVSGNPFQIDINSASMVIGIATLYLAVKLPSMFRIGVMRLLADASQLPRDISSSIQQAVKEVTQMQKEQVEMAKKVARIAAL
jgi:hypothetical protein